MANDLSAPLGRKPRKPAQGAGLLSRSRLPLASIGFGIVALILGGIALRVLLVNDPMGGRPTAETTINTTRNANPLEPAASDISAPVTISAEPEMMAPGGPTITAVGDEVPAGNGANSTDRLPTADGLLPDL